MDHSLIFGSNKQYLKLVYCMVQDSFNLFYLPNSVGTGDFRDCSRKNRSQINLRFLCRIFWFTIRNWLGDITWTVHAWLGSEALTLCKLCDFWRRLFPWFRGNLDGFSFAIRFSPGLISQHCSRNTKSEDRTRLGGPERPSKGDRWFVSARGHLAIWSFSAEFEKCLLIWVIL